MAAYTSSGRARYSCSSPAPWSERRAEEVVGGAAWLLGDSENVQSLCILVATPSRQQRRVATGSARTGAYYSTNTVLLRLLLILLLLAYC